MVLYGSDGGPPSSGSTSPSEDVNEVAAYLVIKHSWKGKYKRIFSIGTQGITTYNPSSMEATNQWNYQDFVSILPAARGQVSAPSNEFIITFKKGRKTDSMRFSSDHRAHIITDAMKFRHEFSERAKEGQQWFSYKHHWSDQRKSVVLVAGPTALEQKDPGSGKVLASYFYKDLGGLAEVSDYPGGFVVCKANHGRMHLFACEARDEIIRKLQEEAINFTGLVLRKKDPVTFDSFTMNKFGRYSDDEFITSIAEFTVQKLSHRRPDPTRRTLCLTEATLLERDPATYNIITLRPLSTVAALVRQPGNPQLLSIQYNDGENRSFLSTDRDSLLASLLDGARASGNPDVHVRMNWLERGRRLTPLDTTVAEEVESSHLKFLTTPPVGWDFAQAVSRFNANIAYSGLIHSVTEEHLFAENKEKLINAAINSLITKEGDQDSITALELEQQFHALRRLVASKAGFSAFTSLSGFREKVGWKVAKALKRNDDGISHAAIDMLCALMEPMHQDYDLRQEQLNKSSLLSSEKFLDGLLDMWTTHVVRQQGALVVAGMLDFLTFALCSPYSETTDGRQFDMLLEKVAGRGRSLFRLFQHPSMTIVKGAGLIMKAIIEEGEKEIGAKMQELALAEGALPQHLLTALFTQSADGRFLTNRQLSQHLVGLWTTDCAPTNELLSRAIPAGLLQYLGSDDKVPKDDIDRLNVRDNLKLAMEAGKTDSNAVLLAAGRGLKTAKQVAKQTAEVVAENTYIYTAQAKKIAEKHMEIAMEHWRTRMGSNWQLRLGNGQAAIAQPGSGTSSGPAWLSKNQDRPIVLRKRREAVKSTANWPLFYYHFHKDHAKSNLIWNYKTREELRETLETEIEQFKQARELSGTAVISWNHMEFKVEYNSLADEIRIGDYFLRLLLEEDQAGETVSVISESSTFFNDLYHRFLLTPKVEMKCLCLQAMAIVYSRHAEDIGPFHDTKYILAMLERSSDRVERDRLVLFLSKLVGHKDNAVDVIRAGGLKTLVDLVTLAHLHTSRAVVPTQTQAIESDKGIERGMEKEWYYGNVDKERNGPVSFTEMKDLYAEGTITAKTKVWAHGMDGWRLLHQVPQLKWTLVARGAAVMNESELATLILNILITMAGYYPSRDSDGAIIRPLPTVKRVLSDPSHLPHIVQLLLTFDPVLVERVAVLLHHVMEDNPKMATLYTSGVFFFILMYTGSNLLPIGRFLSMSHDKQAFHSDNQEASDRMSRSVLGQLIPEAMVAYLDNHGPDKFATTFLGEYDTPEAIWSAEMRQLMIQKIAYHLADFTPRLFANNRAMYQYCPIPVIGYPSLEQELFCDIYYLRNLCDTQKFPAWPISQPVKLLKEVLGAWRVEVDKKPATMSVDDAYKVLGLAGGTEYEDSVLRKSYFRLAQKYHPDKNPAGRDMFEKVNTAYEFLCSKAARVGSGPDPNNIVLILRTQSILFDRHGDDLQPYKYAGYPMLIKTIQMESDDSALFSKSAPLLAAASECAYYTVRCSALNAEELRREQGMEALFNAFERCVSVLSASSVDTDVAVEVCTHIVRCYSVSAQFQACRDRLIEMPELVKNICRLMYYKNLTKLCGVAVECVSSLATDSILQMHFLQAGVLWHLLLTLFDYDHTMEDSGVVQEEGANKQAVANDLAKLAIRALARLGGYLPEPEMTPDNPIVKEGLTAMLTPYLSKQLHNDKPHEVLKMLNSNSESPYLVWDNGTRAELVGFLEEQRDSAVRRGESDPAFGAEFKFSAHKDELVVGTVYIRIYNQHPAFPLEDPKKFTVDLLDFIGKKVSLLIAENVFPTDDVKQGEMALTALANVIRNNSGVEMQTIGHCKMLFSLLDSPHPTVQEAVLSVISSTTGNAECVNDIAAAGVVGRLLVAIRSLPASARMSILTTLYSLFSNTKLVREAHERGAVLYLLDLFCNGDMPTVREKTAEIMAKMVMDKLVGPKVRISITKFLPTIFMDAMKTSPETAVSMLDSQHENPELIWNEDTQAKVSRVVSEQCTRHYQAHRFNPNITWSLSDDFRLSLEDVAGEVVVAGVYLRLFVANPGWVLRRPKQFMEELLENMISLMSGKDNQQIELVCESLVKLLEAQTALAEQLPTTGYIPRIFSTMTTIGEAGQKPAILLLHQISKSSVCVEAMSNCDCVAPLQKAMKIRKDLLSMTCETFNRMFSSNHDSLVSQALGCALISDFLKILGARLENIPNPSACKAHVVKALKAMQRSLVYGDKVSEQLNGSTIWAQYEKQDHSLFIEDSRPRSLMHQPDIAGALQFQHQQLPTEPPPQ